VILTSAEDAEAEDPREGLLEAVDERRQYAGRPRVLALQLGSAGKPKGIRSSAARHHLHVRDLHETRAPRSPGDKGLFGLQALPRLRARKQDPLPVPGWLLDGSPSRPACKAKCGTIKRHEPTLFFSVPTLYNAILFTGTPRPRPVSIRLTLPRPPRPYHRPLGAAGKRPSARPSSTAPASTEMLHIFVSAWSQARLFGRPSLYGQDPERGLPWSPACSYLSVKGDSGGDLYWRNHEDEGDDAGQWSLPSDWYRMDKAVSTGTRALGRYDQGQRLSPVEVEHAGDRPAVIEAAASASSKTWPDPCQGLPSS